MIFSSIFNISSLIIIKFSLNLFFKIDAKLLSFSITNTFLGFFLIYDDVRLPVPGPTSKIILF